jgi:hypothetical protein
MGKRLAQVDQYIEKAAPFAQPILERLRDAFHAAAPDIEEKIKWQTPHFDYKGPVGYMAAFKEHVRYGFWKGQLIDAPGMAGEHLTNVKELPSKKELVATIRQAIRLNEEGVKIEKSPSRRSAKPVEVPDDLTAALKKNKKAAATFEAFSPSHRREYIEWITEAKQDATRKKRLEQTVDWLADGKARNWKYMK